MAKADTSVKWFHSGMADAPVLSGQAGKLVELLDACLIDGFSTRTPDSVSVSAGVATVNISAGNPYEKHAVIAISGASNAALNAEWRIDSSASSSFTFLCPGVADGAVNSASIKRAGAGWGKPFSDTNLAVYRSQNVESPRMYLSVLDTDARFARVRGYEDMAQASAGTNPFPLFSTHTEPNYTWPKSDQIGTQTKKWVVVADDRFFYYLPAFSLSYPDYYDGLWFGDIVARMTADYYAVEISAHQTSSVSIPMQAVYSFINITSQYGIFNARGYQGSTPTPIQTSGRSLGDSAGIGPQAATDNDMNFAPLFRMSDGNTTRLRGVVPGLYIGYEIAPNVKTSPEVFSDEKGGVFLKINTGSQTTPFRQVCFDICGPWR